VAISRFLEQQGSGLGIVVGASALAGLAWVARRRRATAPRSRRPGRTAGAALSGRFARLLATPGVEEVLELRSAFGFLAFHGGSLERMTDRIAGEAARRSGASLYAVVQPAGLREHLPSTQVTPDASPALAAFLDHVDVAVAIHGYGRHGLWSTLLLGGGNRALAAHVGTHLAAELEEHVVCTDLDRMPDGLRGVHPTTP
jgi:phage replication-related protein YjqB (UPF0714/DUF867 family)